MRIIKYTILFGIFSIISFSVIMWKGVIKIVWTVYKLYTNLNVVVCNVIT